MAQEHPASDSVLLEAWAKGEEAAFEALVSRHRGLVLSLCRRQLPGEAADDAMQAVFIVLARRPDQAARAPALEAWLLRTAFLVCQQLRRKHAVRKRIEREAAEAMAPAPASSADPDGILVEVDAAMLRLPERQRAALAMQYLTGRSQAEIASQLGLQVNAVKQLVHRGLEGLRRQLRGKGITVPILGLASLLAGARAEAAEAGAEIGITAARDSSALADGLIRAQDLADALLRRGAFGHLLRSAGLAAGVALALILAGAAWPGRAAPPSPPPAVQASLPAAAPVAAVPAAQAKAPAQATPIGHAELSRLVDEGRVLLIDCTGSAHYRLGHLPGARDAGGERDLGRRLPRERSAPIVVYSSGPGCLLYEVATLPLLRLGYTQVRFYPDGFQGWVAAGGRVEGLAGEAP